ncbi:ABC transporter permease [Agrobacterium rhizogenes]|uniref:ABC transporter permease n=1 Tax=Rhizobium rhizogenes TaxID=359 RepID=UPI0022B6A00F|nr:ABC transporter permease [Rhizobium rhizogenes]MCZ7450887.1 ABC transporter permease [Rhizobium rhizogenes]
MKKIDAKRDGEGHRGPRRKSLAGILLVLPLLLFLLIIFIVPLGKILSLSVKDDDLAPIWPLVSSELRDWDRTQPSEEMFSALAQDMKTSQQARTTSLVARRVNYALPNGRTLINSTARKIASVDGVPPNGWRETFLQADRAWGDLETWQALYQASGPASGFYVLAAFDRAMNATGQIVHAPEENSVYLAILKRTFGIAALVTVISLLLAFPVAYFLANGPKAWRSIVMGLVLLPLWTSLLVRTAAWVVLLQDQGLLNQVLQWLHLTSQPLELIFNRPGVIIAMVHVSLPYMVLPLYATMATIKPDYMRAGESLGATPLLAFRRIYLPLTAPGVAAGCLLVFIMSLGYYITPALVGGASDQMVSYFIAYYTSEAVNWGLAGALALVLIVVTSILYLVYSKIAGTKGSSFA